MVIPQIAVPAVARLPSGLLVPAGSDMPERDESADKRVLAFVDEPSLGLAASTVNDVRAAMVGLPFQPVVLVLARIARELAPIRLDARAQLRLVRELYPDSDLRRRIHRFIAGGPNRIVLSDQHLAVLLRLAVESASDGAGDPTDEQWATLLALLPAAGTLLTPPGVAADVSDRWLAFMLRNGAYFDDVDLFNAVVRNQRVLIELPTEPALKAHGQRLDLDRLHRVATGLSLEQRQAIVLAALAFTDAAGAAPPSPWSSLLPERFAPDLAERLGVTSNAVLNVLAWRRDQLADAFTQLDHGGDSLTWERRPLLHRPFLRLGDGRLLLTTPRALDGWAAHGAYLTLLEQARVAGDVRDLGGWIGVLYERRVLEMLRDAFDGAQPRAAARVIGEVSYGNGKRTCDAVIDVGADLVLVEVGSGRLTAKTLLDADPDQARKDVAKVLVGKAGQLDRVIDALLAGRVRLGGVDLGRVERIWPIVVGADGVLPNEVLWAHVHEQLDGRLAQRGVQPLVHLDPDDVDDLCGLVEGGASIIDVLRNLTSVEYARRGLRDWLARDPRAPRRRRPSRLRAEWHELRMRSAESLRLLE